MRDLLTHLYVLIPVLDADKHYWVGKDEVEKLLRNGEGWLEAHPEREAIVSRYLRGFRNLTREALARLTEDESLDPEAEHETKEEQEQAIEAPIRLHDARLQQVASELRTSGAKRVLDLGCGEGKLIRELLKDKQFEEIVGMDVSYRSLEAEPGRWLLARAGAGIFAGEYQSTWIGWAEYLGHSKRCGASGRNFGAFTTSPTPKLSTATCRSPEFICSRRVLSSPVTSVYCFCSVVMVAMSV